MQSSSRGRMVAATVIAAVAGGVLAVAVAAHTTRDESNVNLNAFTSGVDNNYVYGAVTSPKPACAPDRKVRVFRKRPGDDKLLASRRSIDGGVPGSATYTVNAETGDLPQGVYYAQIRRRDLKPGDNHKHLCTGARSNELPVGP